MDFSSNVNPLGPPKMVSRLLAGCSKRLEEYPDPAGRQLCKKLARYHRISYNRFLIGNGAVQIIYNFCQAFLPGTETLIPAPTFSEYETASRMHRARIRLFETMNISDSMNRFTAQIPKNGCVFLCNPNNPTGQLLSQDQVRHIVQEAADRRAFVFVDESFVELARNPAASVLKYVTKSDNLLVLRSFTKPFGLAGLRIGYAASSPDIIEALQRIQIPWSTNALAQYLAERSLDDGKYLARSRSLIKKEMNYLQSALDGIPNISCYPSDANYILIKTKKRSSAIQSKLLKKRILVRDCSSFTGLDNHHIRVAVRIRRENRALVMALESAA